MTNSYKMKAFQAKVSSIINTAKVFAACHIPDADYEGRYSSPNTGWEETRKLIEERLERPLTGTEKTVLSLSRGYGPCPILEGTEKEVLMKGVWPNGNPRGLYLEWKDIVEDMTFFDFIHEWMFESALAREQTFETPF